MHFLNAVTIERKINSGSNGAKFVPFIGIGTYWYINSDLELITSTTSIGSSFSNDNTLITNRWTSAPYVLLGARYQYPLKTALLLELSGDYNNQLKSLYGGDTALQSGLAISIGLRVLLSNDKSMDSANH